MCSQPIRTLQYAQTGSTNARLAESPLHHRHISDLVRTFTQLANHSSNLNLHGITSLKINGFETWTFTLSALHYNSFRLLFVQMPENWYLTQETRTAQSSGGRLCSSQQHANGQEEPFTPQSFGMHSSLSHSVAQMCKITRKSHALRQQICMLDEHVWCSPTFWLEMLRIHPHSPLLLLLLPQFQCPPHTVMFAERWSQHVERLVVVATSGLPWSSL